MDTLIQPTGRVARRAMPLPRLAFAALALALGWVLLAGAPAFGSSGRLPQRVEAKLRHIVYRFRRAFRTNGGWRADGTASFNLGAAGPLRHDGYTSADAGGLPILPGLVRYDEVAAGAVHHAIRVTFGETRRAYIHPATHYAASSCSSRLPAMGLRLRMKRGYFRKHLSGYPDGSQSRPIFVALYHYGFIVADNGSDWFFQGGSDSRWNDDDLSRLKRVPGSAFQVIESAARTKTGC